MADERHPQGYFRIQQKNDFLFLFGGTELFCNAFSTRQENVLFGESASGERYYKVLFASALNVDVQSLPGADHTEV